MEETTFDVSTVSAEETVLPSSAVLHCVILKAVPSQLLPYFPHVQVRQEKKKKEEESEKKKGRGGGRGGENVEGRKDTKVERKVVRKNDGRKGGMLVG